MKFKPIILFVILLMVIMVVNVAATSVDNLQHVSIATILTSDNTQALHPGVFLTDGRPETYWAVKPNSGGGWVELSLNQPALIHGLELNGSLGNGNSLILEYQRENGYWSSFLTGSLRNIPESGIIDLSYDQIVTGRIRIQIQGTNPDQARLNEIKLNGQPAKDIFHRTNPRSVEASGHTSYLTRAEFLTDGNTYTAWMVKPRYRSGQNWLFETIENYLGIPINYNYNFNWPNRPSYYNYGEVSFDLGQVHTITNINIYFTPDTRGDLTVESLSGGAWNRIGFIPAGQQSGWRRLPLNKISASKIRLTMEATGHESVGGISEVEIWGYGAYPGSRQQELGPQTASLAAPVNRQFKLEPEKSRDHRLDIAVESATGTSLALELNGKEYSAPRVGEINGQSVFALPLTDTMLAADCNYLRIKPQPGTMTGLKLTYNGDGIQSHQTPVLNDGLLFTPGDDSAERIIDLTQKTAVEQIEVYTSEAGEIVLSYQNGADWVTVNPTETTPGLIRYQTPFTTGRIRLVNPSRVALNEVRILGSPITDRAPEVRLLRPQEYEVFDCDQLSDKYLVGFVDNPRAKVKVNGKDIFQLGHYFGCHLTAIGIPTWEETLVAAVATDEQGRIGKYETKIVIDKLPWFTLDQPAETVTTGNATYQISGELKKQHCLLKVNGQTVTDKKGRFNTQVNLDEGLNLIKIECVYEKPGNGNGNPKKDGFTQTVYRKVVRYSEQLQLQVTAPLDNSRTSAASLIVTGKVYGLTPVKVWVNGKPASVDGADFQLPVTLTEGSNTITVKAQDAGNRVATVTLTVRRDTTPPVLTVVQPSDQTITNSATVTVSGTIADDSPSFVMVNGGLVELSANQFTTTLNLPEGWNQILIKAEDAAGNVTEKAIKVMVDTIAPAEFTPSADPSGWTNNNRPTISFATTDETSGLDHYEIRVDDGTWITSVTSPYRFATAIPDGEHIIQVKAVDKAGNETIGEVEVYIDTTPPSVPEQIEVISGINYLALNWKDSYDDVIGYRIERVPEFSGEKYREISRTVKENIIEHYIDKEVQSGEIYAYSIKAIDRAGNYSSPSNFVSGKVGIVSKPIGENGGKVKFDRMEVIIPEQALEMQAGVVIEEVKTELPVNPYAVKLGPAYDIKLSSEQGLEFEDNFKKPVILRIKYGDLALPDDYDPGDLGIYWYNEEGGYWEKLDYVVNDYLNQTLIVKTLHFSKYQIMLSKYVSPSLESYYNMGVSPFKAYYKDNTENVATTNGSLAICATDLRLPGRDGFDLLITRIYDSAAVLQEKIIESNSVNNTKAPVDTFGSGWSLNIPWIETNDKGKFIRLPEGQTVKIELKNGRFEYHEGIHFTVLLQNNNYNLIMKDGTRYYFDGAGRVVRRVDPSGKNEIRYEYNGREISRIIDSIGRIITFSYRSVNGKRVIEKIQSEGRTVQYGYPDVNTFEVSDPLNRKTTYKYQSFSLKIGDYAKWGNEYTITYRHSDSLPQYDVGGRSVTTNRVKNISINLIKEVVYPTGAISAYSYSVKDQDQSESWDERNHYFRDVPGFPGWTAEVEERYFGAVNYYGQKILVVKHNLAGKETLYSYNTNVKSGTLRNNDFIPAHSYVLSAQTKVGEKITDESFRQIVHDGGLRLVEKVEEIPFYKGTLPISNRISLNSKEIEQVKFEYNLPLRAVYREAHYRGGASSLAYEIVNTHDDWGNLIYRWDGSRNLEENWTYQVHPTIKTLVKTYLQKNFNPVTQEIITLDTSYQYNDSIGKPTEITVKNGEEILKTTFTYYDNGNLHTKTEPNGLTTEFVYDENGAFPKRKIVHGVKDADGNPVGDIETKYYYNQTNGMKEWEEDPLGNRTIYQYDALNRITKVVLPDDDTDPTNNPKREYLFDDANNTCEYINEKGQKTLFSFDGLGRLTRIDKYPKGLSYSIVSTRYHYNNLGQLERVTDPCGFETLYEYDGLNRVTKVTYPEVNGLNPYIAISYDDQSNTVIIRDENGGIITERKDWADRLVEAIQSCRFEDETEDYIWRFTYDSLGNTLRETDPLWNRTDRQFDALSRLLQIKLPQDKLILPGSSQPQDHRPVTLYQYDSMGNQTVVISPNGFKTEYEYDLLGRRIKEIVRTTDPITGQIVTSITKHYYDAAGNKVMTVDPNNGIWRYQYSARGYLLSETDPSGNISTYRYDALGNKIAATDPRGNGIDGKFTTWYLYDDLNRLYRTVLPDNTPPADPYSPTPNYDNPYLEITYDEAGNKLTERDANGMVTSYTYNSRNWVLTVSRNGQVITKYTYDLKGNTVKIEDAVNNVTTNHYDSLGRLRRTEYPKNTVKFQYDALGSRTIVEDGGGNRTSYHYNGLGWLTGVTDALGRLTKYDYDPNGNRVRVITPNDFNGLTTTYRYDELNRLAESVNSLGLKTSYSYDPAGNLRERRDPRGTKWVYQYEPNNLLKRLDLTGSDGATYWVEYEYDPAGNRKTVKDSNGSISFNSTNGVYQADPLNRINSVDRRFDGAEYRTSYRYDKAGLVTGIRYPEAHEWLEYRYNGLNQLNEVVGFTKPQGISYYPDGMLQVINYQNGAVTSFSYDQNRRLDMLQVNLFGKDLMKLDYEYYPTNNIMSINDRTFEYDAVNQLTKAYTPGKFMEPTAASAITGLVREDCYGTSPLDFEVDQKALVSLDHSSSSIGLCFDDVTRISKIVLTPDEEHQTHRITDGTFEIYVSGDNSTYEEVARDCWEYQKSEAGEIILTFKEILTTRYLKLNVLFDERSPSFEPEEGEAQFLNELARMLRVYQEAESRTEEYQYDPAGNRKRRDIKLVRTYRNDYTYYANSNRLKSDGKYAYAYDNAGNLIKKGNSYTFEGEQVNFTTSGEGVEYWEYKYDLLNRLVEVKKNESTVSEYVYDPEGYRVVKRAKGETIHYVFEGSEPIFEKNITTEKVKSYVYALGKHLARVDGVIGDTQANVYYYHTDHLGSIKSVTDEAGKEVYNADYFAFGGKFGGQGDFDELHGFTGKEYDPGTGLYYFNARWYDSEVGRFISEDMVYDPNNLNLYTYVANNPLNLTDLTGNNIDYNAAIMQANFEKQLEGLTDRERAFVVGLYNNRYSIEDAITILNILKTQNMITNQQIKDLGYEVWEDSLWTISPATQIDIMYKFSKLVVMSAEEAPLGNTYSEELGINYLPHLVADKVIKVKVANEGTRKTINASDLKMSKTVQNHVNDIIKKGPYKGEVARPYIDSNGTTLLIDEIMQAGTPVKDTVLKNGLRWDVQGTFRGSNGTWELVVDTSTNTIVHFNFVAK